LNKLLHPLYGYPLAALELFRALGQSFSLLHLDHQPTAGRRVSRDFFGVNVAPGADSDADTYIVDRLRELGLSQVRMDFSYESLDGPAQRLLDRLLGEGFEVMLDLLPPLGEASLLFEDAGAQQRWADFLHRVFSRYQGQISCYEIGNTPNRGRWSGFSSPGIVMASYIGREQAKPFDIRLGGPNVSDFEPLYNATYLGLLKRLDAAPDVHTDNLFVERVIEPEAYDHRVLGTQARDWLKLNLVKKARMLQAMGQAAGSPELFCTYTCWTIKRLQRRSAWPEQKRVDYLVRYLALAAASGALTRVYWGPLICSRDGLVDDAADDYPVIDQVSYYQRIRGSAENFKATPAFAALAHVVHRLSDADCLQIQHDPNGLSAVEYRSAEGQHFLLCWCRDAQCYPLEHVLDQQQQGDATYYEADGSTAPRPVVINEHPLYIELPGPYRPPACKKLHTSNLKGIDHLSSEEWQSVPYASEQWLGARLLRQQHQPGDLLEADALTPDAIPGYPELRVLRDVRNRLWNIQDPRNTCDEVTVKLNRVKGIKRFTYRFRPSKGRRHWNNACQMLRRGIPTPLPLAFYESPTQAGIRDSWYLCQFVPQAYSARDVYAAFRQGEQVYRGRDKDNWLDLIAGFVCNMHNNQVVHRDLSSGNLLIADNATGVPQLQAIDIGRAWIWSGPGSKVRNRHRMLDLIRIAYKLDWPDRYRFIDRYEAHLGKSLSPLWRIPFVYYDSKQRLKKALKRKRRKSRES
jgi:Lipopolysaccharide kinase (Kdo/WaaP) family